MINILKDKKEEIKEWIILIVFLAIACLMLLSFQGIASHSFTIDELSFKELFFISTLTVLTSFIIFYFIGKYVRFKDESNRTRT